MFTSRVLRNRAITNVAGREGRKVVIVGGVAGGASTAARLRRLDESANILLLDRGPYVSFANCGLPYYVGEVIKDEADLLVATPDLFRNQFNIEVRTKSNVKSVNAKDRTVMVEDLSTGKTYEEAYDALVLSPGAAPMRPPLPGIDMQGVFALRTIPDSRVIRSWIQEHAAKRAAVIGGGFIGLEMAENLSGLGLETTVIERMPQLLPPLDEEMAYPLREKMEGCDNVKVILNDGVKSFNKGQNGSILSVETQSGKKVDADLVLLAIGVRPEGELAKSAGIEFGPRGGILVDHAMRTSDTSIWAVGDAVETSEFINREDIVLPLAGPANRQGRICAASIAGHLDSGFRGVQGTAVCGAFGLTMAMTGESEKTLSRTKGFKYDCVYIHPGQHVKYYPGAVPISLKLIFNKTDGRVLGAQAVGEEGVEKRIDVISMAIQMKATVFDLAEAELCYAPQFGAAKDPVNIAGMVASHVVDGDSPLADLNDLGFVLDVRTPEEFMDKRAPPQAVNIELDELRSRVNEVPKEGHVSVICEAGQRAYYAVRMLRQHGVDARNISGGCLTYQMKVGCGLIKSSL